MSAPTVSLVLHEPDSLRVLRAALEGQARLYASFATYHHDTAPIRAAAGEPSEAKRHKRQAATYRQREALALQLVDQLPTTPKGE